MFDSHKSFAGADFSNANQVKIDKLTRMLCSVMRAIDDGRLVPVEGCAVPYDTKEVDPWWQEHKEKDRREQERLLKIEKENQLKQSALSKLTWEEKLVLGLAYTDQPMDLKNK